MRPTGRSFLPDALKAFGCLLIVLHHLASYGPMSDVVLRAWPQWIDGLYEHGRLAVQVFLVCSGFLMAQTLDKIATWGVALALRMVWRRYLRLVIPLLAALSVTVLMTELLRGGEAMPHLSATPDWQSALAHLLLVQHVLDIEALSAGIWYVAIDFQLYLITLLTLLCAAKVSHRFPLWDLKAVSWQIWMGLSLVSLLVWNLNDDLDNYGVFFFGSYGMGLLASRGRQNQPSLRGWAVLVSLGGLALWVDPRWRIVTAWACALLLMAAPATWFSAERLPGRWRQIIQSLSEMSYSVFLIHYAVIISVSAFVFAFWPDDVWANALGMGVTVGLSVWLGGAMQRLTERQPHDLKHLLAWSLVFMTSVWLAMNWS
ncbi:acyltransferase family protein [Limnohabitans sp. DCL3]|uniref:acyltransferase family protein n=1 Tax=Limnohabitans sp. DCL3 TaxID=3374103 RepID=UPI003A893994